MLVGALSMLTLVMRDFLLRQSAGACAPSAVKFLLALHADPNDIGAHGTSLHHAVRCGDAANVMLLLDHGADVDRHDRNGHTALMIASATGRITIVDLLLDRGANINGVSPEFSPLRAATRSNRVAVVRDLLARGARPAHGDGQVVSELHIAAASAAADVIPVLVAAGAPLEARNQLGETPAFSAARRDARTLGALIEAGANVNTTNNQGATPLMEAVRDCRSSSVRLLVAAGAEVAVRDAGGGSPLDIAAKCNNRREMIEALSASP
jgi:ankyrin repeat protein